MKNPKLSDTQLILLSTAAQHENGSVLPVPPTIAAKPPQVKKSLEGLLKRQLITEQPVTISAEAWRQEDDCRFGLVITDQGRAALALEDAPPGEVSREDPPAPAASAAARQPGAKQAQLIEMLERPAGASLEEITAATAWLPHSARAMLTGLRKRGFNLTSDTVDGVRRYRAAGFEIAK